MKQWRVYVYCIGHGQETNLLSGMEAEFHGCNQHEAAGVESDFIVHVGINKKSRRRRRLLSSENDVSTKIRIINYENNFKNKCSEVSQGENIFERKKH